MYIRQHSDFFRLCIVTVNGKSIELHNIVIYKNGKELFRTNGYFSHKGSYNDIWQFKIDAPKLSNKLNLNRTDNFVIKEQKQPESLYRREKTYTLYIHENNAPMTIKEEEKLECSDSEDTYYVTFVEIFIPHEKRQSKGTWEASFLQLYNRRSEKTKYGEKLKKTVDKLVKEFSELSIQVDGYQIKDILKYYKLVRRKKNDNE